MTTTALITRPDEDAEPLAQALAQRGIEVAREPLLAVRPIAGASIDLAGVQAVVFTSANGVRAFASLSSRRDLPAFAVGDATARTAREAGFARVESASGTVDDLAALIEKRLSPKQGPLLHAAGSAVAGDLAGRLGRAGFELRRAVVYETETATQLTPETRDKFAAGDIGIVLLFSPRTAETFVRLARGAGPAVTAGIGKSIALALSPAVARAVEALKWRDIRIADRPELPAMLALVDRAAAELGATVVPPEPAPRSSAASSVGRETIVDVTAEPVPNPADIEAALKRMTPRRRPIGMFVALALLIAIGIGGYFTQELWRPYLDSAIDGVGQIAGTGGGNVEPTETVDVETKPEPAAAPIEPRLEAIEADVKALKNLVAALESGLANLRGADWPGTATKLEQGLGETRDKLGKLEQALRELQEAKPADGSEEIAGLREQLAAQAAEIAALGERLAAAPATAPSDGALAAEPAAAAAATEELEQAVDALREENAALKAALDEAQTKLAEVGPIAERVAALEASTAETAAEGDNVALVLAVSRLSSAVSSARPFTSELAALKGFAAEDEALTSAIDKELEPIAGRAATGIPTLSDLRQAFPELARKLTRAGSDAADAEPGWFQRFLDSIAGLVSVRPTGADAAGDSVGARVARAEAALNRADLAAAATELEGMPGAADWVAAARARAAAGPAIDALEAMAVARLGKAADDAATSGG